MTNVLQINLLGGFSVQIDGQAVTKFRSAKARALLAYLAAQPDQDHARATLATLLWGGFAEATAKTNLRIELSNLAKRLSSHPALEISRTVVRLHSQHALIDVASFRHGVAAFLSLPPEAQTKQLSELAQAIDHYQGEFLAGFYLNDALEFEEWQLLTQEQLHEQMMLALATLQQHYAGQGSWAALAGAAQRQLAFAPWLESAHRHLVQALAAQGQVQAALAQYEKCRTILQTELGVEPSLATQEIVRRVRAGGAAAPALAHNLAQQLKSMVGRVEEIARLNVLVQRERLVTLVGMGGVGKSRLAQAVAQNAIHEFADGVWFVPLANLEASDAAPDRIALAIAGAIGYQLLDMQRPLAELVAHLAGRRMLLVLDNWEHLITAAETVFDQLLNRTGVHILATSRVRLFVGGETPVELTGLPPNEAHTLFRARARHLVPTFARGEKEAEIAPAIDRICEQVSGLPLGIELAASWVEHFSVAEIGQSLATIAIEPEQADGLVDRHQNLNTVFEYSWRLLSQGHQQILARLSAFRGGFDRKAAAVVASSSLSDLSTLLAHSLVQRVAAGRYDLHPLVQEFVAAKLAAAEMLPLIRTHSRHYLHALMTSERNQRSNSLLVDFENIRRGWQYAVQAVDDELVAQAAVQFADFIRQFGLLTDGNQLLQAAIEQFSRVSCHADLVAILLDRQTDFVRALDGLGATVALHERVLRLTTSLALQARSHLELANYYGEIGLWERADFHFDRAEARAEASSELGLYVHTVESRIHINAIHFRGDFGQGVNRLEEMLTLLDAAQTPIAQEVEIRFSLLQSIALVANRHRNYALAIRYGLQTLAWTSEMQHRSWICYSLLDLALAEQFAGLYSEAIAHNQEALALAEEIGDRNESGVLQANLCLTLRQCGEYEQALMYGLAAIATLSALDEVRLEGQARNRIGHTLVRLGRWADAYSAYRDALVVWEPLKHPNRYEAMAGCALVAFHLGEREEALDRVNEVRDFVAANGLVGIVEPVLLLLNCEAVLTGVGQFTPARQVLEQANCWVQTVADRNNDQTVRNAFLHNRPDNQALKARLAALV